MAFNKGEIRIDQSATSKCSIRNNLPIAIKYICGVTESVIQPNITVNNLEFPQTNGIYRNASIYAVTNNSQYMILSIIPSNSEFDVFYCPYIQESNGHAIPAMGVIQGANGSGSLYPIVVYDIQDVSSISFNFSATTAIDAISFTTSNGSMNVNLSETNETYGTWQMSWGNNPTVSFTPSESHVLFKPKVGTNPNVNQSLDVIVGGQTTTYKVNTNPQISLEAGKDMQVQVSSPAPTIDINYTNTTTPIITDTPTGG